MSDLKQLAERYANGLTKRSGDERMLAKVKARFFEQVQVAQAPKRAWRIAVPAAVLGGLAIAVVAVLSVPRAPMHVAVRGHAEQSADFVLAAREAQALDFSDGSEVLVRPDSQLRLLEVTPDGASATLERGSAHVSVVHRNKTKWTFTAGPYRVHVVGTKFELQWNPDAEGIRVQMEEGVVEVDGPGMVRRRVAGHDMLEVSALPSPEAVDVPEPQEAEAQQRARPHHLKSAGQAPVGGPATPPWRFFALRDDAASAYAAAEQAGFSSLAGSMPQTDVLLLGDMARQAKKPERAKEAYLAVRDRFPGQPASIDAALRMGHLMAEVSHDDARAAWWYERALREAPSGATAPEAMSRWLEVLARGPDHGAARNVAQDYLRRFPNGDDAALARDVLR
jgi:hypothetical protein